MLEQLKEKPRWKNYLSYIQARQDGLKEKADFFLARFVAQMKTEEFDERKEFVGWICNERYENKASIKWIAREIQTAIIDPTLLEWKVVEADNPIPHRWLNTMESLIKAIDLDPDEQIARYLLYFKIISFVDYNQHALFDNIYQGKPDEDLGLLNLLLLKLPGLNINEPENIFEEIIFRAKTAEYFIQYNALPQPRPDSFLNWLSLNFPDFNFHDYFTPVEPPEGPDEGSDLI